jgi:hypothetical protein
MIVAQNGTAGRVELAAWIGHELGGHGIIARLTDGQHGFSDHAYLWERGTRATWSVGDLWTESSWPLASTAIVIGHSKDHSKDFTW